MSLKDLSAAPKRFLRQVHRMPIRWLDPNPAASREIQEDLAGKPGAVANQG